MLLLLAATALAAAAPPHQGALERAADLVAARALDGLPPARVALVARAPGHAGLCDPLLAALAAAVARGGHAALPLAAAGGGSAESDAAAREAGASFLLEVRATLPGPDLALAGELRPLRPSFFLQRAPAVRPGGGRLVTVAVPADAAARGLAGERPRPGAPLVVPLAEVAGRILALAAGPAREDGAVRIAAVTEGRLLLLDASGAVLASRSLPAPPPGPRVRDAAAVVAIGAFGGGRIAWTVAGRGAGEVVSAEGDRLRPGGDLATAALACGGAGPLHGGFAPGRGVLLDALSRDPGTLPPAAAGGALLGAAASPRAGRIAYAVLQDDFRLRLLGPALEPAGELPGVGAGFALADLDGDGEPEVIASSDQPGADDAVRVLRADGRVVLPPVRLPGAILAGASADLTGDGLDDALLAAVQPGGTTRLWLVTADPRSAR